MFGVFRKNKTTTKVDQSLCPGSYVNKPPAFTIGPDYLQPMKHHEHAKQYQPPQKFNPVMYVTGPPQSIYPEHDDVMKYPNTNGGVNGGVHYTDNTNHAALVQRKSSHHKSGSSSKSERGGGGGGPPPVQSKWVDLDDPNQKVRKSRTHRHNPAVIRSTSAGSVKSQSSVGSNYSTKSEQFKNSVRIPDTKFSGSWTSNESVGRTSRASNTSKQNKRVREWDVDVGRKPDSMVKPPPSLKSSCGNLSTGSSGKRPLTSYPMGHMSSSTPPPSYHSDPLSVLSPPSSNGYINKRTTTQHPNQQQQQHPNYPQQHSTNESMLSGYGSNEPGRVVTATLYKTTKGFGFTLSGGDKTGQPVMIKSVKQGSPADTQGGLLAGDTLVRVNGQMVNNLTHSNVVQLFKNIPNGAEARLELRRNDLNFAAGPHPVPPPHHPHQHGYHPPHQGYHHGHQGYHPGQQGYHPNQYQQHPPPVSNGNRGHYDGGGGGAESSSSRSTGSVNNSNDLIPVYIDKGDHGFGFTIHQSSAGQRIKSVMDRGRCTHLLEGDLIVQINNESLMNKTHAETVSLLKSIPPQSRTLLLINRSEPDPKRKDKKNRSFRSRQQPTIPSPPQIIPPAPHQISPPPHQIPPNRGGPPVNPLTQPRMPLSAGGGSYPVDSNRVTDHRVSDHGSSISGSDRQRQHIWESPVRGVPWDPVYNSQDTGDYQDVPVTLQRDNNGFGFKVIGGEEQGIPVAIGHVSPDGPAAGLLQVYDELRSINGQSVLGAYHNGVLQLIGQAAAFQGKISLVVRRHNNPELLFHMPGMQLFDMDMSRYKLTNVRNVTVTKEPDECFGFVINSSLKADDTFKIGKVVPDSPAGRCPDLFEGDSVIAVNGTAITGLQHRTVVELIKKCGTSVLLGVGTPQLVEGDEDGTRNETEEISITLERDERGFGFSIRGGKAFQEEDTLFVLRIGKDGVADRDGRLRRGDEIVEINGQNMSEVPHQDAVDKIKSGPSTLHMVVRRRKLEIPPIIQLGLEDKPDVLQYPERTEIKSDPSSSRKGGTPEKDLTPVSSPALSLSRGDPNPPTTVHLSRDAESARAASASPAVSLDDTFTARDDARHEYDVYNDNPAEPDSLPED